jgi:epoxyqueuosine reductase QueG
MSKEDIRQMGLSFGADVVGFAAVEDYKSKRAPDPKTLLPGIRSMIVLGFREMNGQLASEVGRISMHSRIGQMELTRNCTFHTAKALEDRFKVKAAPIMPSYPLNMAAPVMGLVADVSLRHAAVAAGLGAFGRHNLVISPRFGTRILFTAILTDMELKSDPPVTEDLCDECNLCVEACPARALDEEGKTDNMKCLRVSQPFGIGGAIGYIRKFTAATPEQQKAMIMDPQFLSLYQASFIGFQYECYRCMAVCPVCVDA